MSFKEALKTQRWDDHRYYHHSRINQSLHFVSALSFLYCYAVTFSNPALAGLVGWLVSMTTRQAGHFLFEPRGYDYVNDATFEHKEAIKVGYNLRRKIVLLSIWAFVPVALLIDPDLFGTLVPHVSWSGYVENVGWIWFWLGVAGLLFRTVHLFFIKDVQTGLVWFTKILTDPFHDAKIYCRSPLALLRGELITPSPGH